MAIVMKASTFVDTAKKTATDYKTLYVYGCFGAPMNAKNKQRYTHNYAYNERPDRTKKILAASYDTFGFDCVCLLKGILWGWCGNVNATYGGATYGANGVPDTSADGMFNQYCYDRSSDFSNIQIGEFVWLKGHIGVYVGGGLVVECTPIWKDGCQLTALGNIGKVSGYPTRTWTQHGKSKFLEYDSPVPPTPTDFFPPKGYYTVGDSDSHVELIDNFLANKTLGELFGTYTKFAVMALQDKYNISGGIDGNIGKYTLNKLYDLGLSKSVKLPKRGYYTMGDSGDNITQINRILAKQIWGDYYGIFTKYSVEALQTIGKNNGIYNDVIDGNYGPKTDACAQYYGFKH